MKSPVAVLGRRILISIGLLFAGCGKKEATPREPPGVIHNHQHQPPHGGTPVVLGEEAYHLEITRDPAAGSLQAYVLDGEMENFIRSPMPSFEVVALVAGEKHNLNFQAVADAATGEKVGDTSMFEARADWIKTTDEFDATVTEIVIRGTSFKDVKFNFPKGNDREETNALLDKTTSIHAMIPKKIVINAANKYGYHPR